MTPRQIALQAELTDTRAWLDQFAAAPAPVAAGLDLRVHTDGPLQMLRSRIPFSHFNMVLTLGCPAPADEPTFTAIERFYAGTRHWVLVNDCSEPDDLAAQLLARGYEPAGVWDRVVARSVHAARCAPHAHGCEFVDAGNVVDWIAFVRGCYGMPAPIGDWLQALAGRPGWIHAFRREGGQPGARIVMARSLFIADDGWAWLGIDAPVPGVMAPCFDDDRHVTATLLTAAARAGAHAFVSDIEAPSPTREGRVYDDWRGLGFECVYRRALYARG